MPYARSFHFAPHSLIQAAVAQHLRQTEGTRGIASDHPLMARVSSILATLPRRRAGDPRTRIAINPADPTSVTATHCIALLADYWQAKHDGDEQEAAEIASEYFTSSCDDAGWIHAAWDYLDAEWSGDQLTYVPPASSSDDSFVYPLPEKSALTIGILGDWGTGEPVAEQVLTMLMQTPDLDLIIHVGDIYYAGTADEVQANYLGVIETVRKATGCKVPIYNLPGNHDYYTAGQPFYDALTQVNQGAAFLPPDPPGQPTPVSTQTASFWSLCNSWLQLQGMDTGYYDSDLFDAPNDTTQLRDDECAWHLQQLGDAEAAGRAVFLFSHHQPWTAFEQIGDGPATPFGGGYDRPPKRSYNAMLSSQLMAAPRDTVLAWIWGHEHVLEVYDDVTHSQVEIDAPPLPAEWQSLSGLFPWVPYGACIGYSAFPMFDSDNPYGVSGEKIVYDPGYVLGTVTNDATVYNHGYTILAVTKADSGPPSATAAYYQVAGDGSSTAASLVGNAVSTISPLPAGG